jgi:ATP-dependent DNA helicase RecQ
LIARHFSESAGESCGTCDVCSSPEFVRERRAQSDAAPRARPGRGSAEAAPEPLSAQQEEIVVAFVDALIKPLGRRVIVKGLRGSRARDVQKRRLSNNRHFGALKECSEEALFGALDALLARGLLVRKGKKYPTLWVAGKAVRPARPRSPSSGDKPRPLANALKNYRRREARRRRLKLYQVFQNRTLEALCTQLPRTEAELHDVWGLGEERVRKYGGDLLSIIHSAG